MNQEGKEEDKDEYKYNIISSCVYVNVEIISK